MASIRTMFETLIDEPVGNKIEIEVQDESEYETIRVMLVKLWSKHKEVLSAIADEDPFLANSLCSDFCSGEGNSSCSATFYLGKPRRKKARSFSFVVVSSTIPESTEARAESTSDAIHASSNDDVEKVLPYVVRPK